MEPRVLLRVLRLLPGAMFQLVLTHLPSEAGVLLRRAYYTPRFASCGRDLTILPGVVLTGLDQMAFGDNVMIRENAILHAGSGARDDPRDIRCVGPSPAAGEPQLVVGNDSRIAFAALLLAYGGVRIGEKCGVGPGSVVLSESYHHKGSDPNRIYKYSQGARPEEQCVLRGMVRLENGAGIASNVIVLPGAHVGRDSWVGPNSVVRVGGRVPRDVIAKGDPAAVVFKRTYGRADGGPAKPTPRP
jgi:acetyltransferase-like isoleucine patch superfamily enzyme